MCLAQGPQRSDAGEARTRGTSVSSQALYHWATALPRISSYRDLINESPLHIDFFSGSVISLSVLLETRNLSD